MKATHKEIEQMVGLKKVLLKPGQFIYGRSKASAETGIKQTTLTDCMIWLKNNETIDINPTTKYSVVTIINWAFYQSEDLQTDNKPTTNRQQTDTNKKVKNKKNNISSDFEVFYAKFPRREGRADAEKAWRKIKESEIAAVMSGVERYNIKTADTEKRFIKTPAAWLNGRRWEDDFEEMKPEINMKGYIEC
jgi:hypothetical protein